VWSFVEARRLGMRTWWLYVAITFVVAFAVAFPLFLLARDRRLAELDSLTRSWGRRVGLPADPAGARRRRPRGGECRERRGRRSRRSRSRCGGPRARRARTEPRARRTRTARRARRSAAGRSCRRGGRRRTRSRPA